VFANDWNDILDVAFSPDGQTLASGSRDGAIKLRDLGSRAVPRTIETPGMHLSHFANYCGVVFSPDGKTLASVTSGKILL